MLKSVNSLYKPSLVITPNIKIPIKLGSNIILYNDIFPNVSSELTYFPVLVLTYRGDKKIILKTFNLFPISIKRLSNNEVKCYMNDSLIVIQDMTSVLLMPLIKENVSCQIMFDCLREEYYSFDEEEHNNNFLDNLIEYFDKEKQKLIKEKNDLDNYLKYLNASQSKKLLTKRKRSSKKSKLLKITKWSVKKKCSICLEVLDNTCYLNTCKHEFCSECINKWSELSNQCPLCKISFDKIVLFIPSKQKIVLKAVKQQKFTPTEEPVEEWYNQCDETCLICKKGDQNHLLLVCDKCNTHIAHTYCVGLDVIPEGEWHCPICSNKSTLSPILFQRKNKKKVIQKKLF